MKFRVTDTITVDRVAEVEAESAEEALRKARAGEYVLISDDYVDGTPWEIEAG